MPARRLELVSDRADELAAALADGARAQHEDGDLQVSRQSFEHAYRLAEQAGDAQAMAQAALGLAGLWVRERRTVTSAVLLQHVLSLLEEDSALASSTTSRLRTGPRWRPPGSGWPRRTRRAAGPGTPAPRGASSTRP